MNRKILIVGSLNMDMVIEMKHMPLVGETVLGSSLTYVPGGKGANQAYAVGKFGGKAFMLGCVGEDSFGDVLINNIKMGGADCSNILKAEHKATGIAVIYVNEEGDNSIVVTSGANEACDKEYLKEHEVLFKECDYVMFQMEIPKEAVYYGIKIAKELGKTVILNPAPALDFIPDDVLDKIDYLTPNETELLKLANKTDYAQQSIEDIEAAASILLEKGVKNLLVTLGEKGAYFFNKNEKYLCLARKVEAIDTTAAGDCFNAAFVTALSKGKREKEAIIFANMASSLAVMRKGAQSSIPELAEIEQLLKESE